MHTIETSGRSVTEGLGRVLLESLGYLPWLILIPILAFFLLKDAGRFRQSALRVLPRGIWRWRGDEFFDEVNNTLAAYIRAQLLACLLIGTVCTLGFSLIRVPYALLLGVVAGLLEFIPLVGPLVVAVLATLVASFYSAKQAIAVVAFLGILRIVHDYVVYPRLIGQGIHLHPLVVILAILSGAELGGVAGIFLAIPVVAVVSVSYRHGLQHRSTAGLVADWLKPVEPAMSVTLPSSSPAELSTERSERPSDGSSTRLVPRFAPRPSGAVEELRDPHRVAGTFTWRGKTTPMASGAPGSWSRAQWAHVHSTIGRGPDAITPLPRPAERLEYPVSATQEMPVIWNWRERDRPFPDRLPAAGRPDRRPQRWAL